MFTLEILSHDGVVVRMYKGEPVASPLDGTRSYNNVHFTGESLWLCFTTPFGEIVPKIYIGAIYVSHADEP